MKTILLVDNDVSVRSTFSLILRNRGYRVIEAASGYAGFEVAKQLLPDLILTDISMPGGGGEALLYQIRHDSRLSHKQVVLTTGAANAVTPEMSLELGADDLLVKPVTEAALLRCIDTRLNHDPIPIQADDNKVTRLRSPARLSMPDPFLTSVDGILGLTEKLRTDLERFSADETREILGDLHNTVLRLHRTLRSYRKVFNMPETSHEPIRMMANLSINDVKDALQTGIKEAVRRRGRMMDVTVRLEECAVIGSKTELTLIAEELVDNACNYSRRGTTVEVHFGRDGVLTIRDSGEGIGLEDIRQFEALQRFEPARTGQLGLGLILVNKLTAQCGAKLWMERRPSQGTEVRVAFQTCNRVARAA